MNPAAIILGVGAVGLGALAASRARAMPALKLAKPAEPKKKASAKASATKDVSVKAAQTLLTRLGAKLAIDGKYGPNTQKAWVTAAAVRDLPELAARVNGTTMRVDDRTAKALAKAAADAPPLAKQAKSATKAKAKPSPDLEADRAAALKAAREAKAREESAKEPSKAAPKKPILTVATKDVQTILRQLGAELAPDGKYGPVTAKYWAGAAKNRELDGAMKRGASLAQVSVYKATYERLAHDAAAKKASAPPKPSEPAKPAPAPAPAPAPMRTAPITHIPAAVENVVVTVLRAQQILSRHGAKLTADGLYGPNTRGAWEKLATTHRVSPRFERVDGKQARVDAQTLRKLENLPPSGAATAPVGYDRTKAKARAREIAQKLRQQGRAYDRRMLAGWQTQAGLEADGLYGPQSRNALVYYGATDAPAPYVRGTDRPYTPPA